MEQYKQEFIEFMVDCDVLKFGEFTLKSGRKSPFFMNAGAYVTGSQLKKLGEYYAKAIHDRYGDDFDVLRTYYMDTMNIGNTIQYANRLKEQRERAQAAEEARIKAEQERKEQEEARKKVEAEQPKVSQPNPFNTANQRMNGHPSFMDQPKEQPVPAQPELLTRAFKVTTTRENIIALGNFMNEHGIDFDKIEVP